MTSSGPGHSSGAPTPEEDAAEVATLARGHAWTVGVAESLTRGAVAAVLGAAPRADDWFRGAIVANVPEVTFRLLGVRRGPVTSRVAALGMAQGACREIAVATTGVAGPEPEDGQPPGTVWLAVSWPHGVHVEQHHVDGDPSEVSAAATARAVALLRLVLEDPSGRRLRLIGPAPAPPAGGRPVSPPAPA